MPHIRHPFPLFRQREDLQTKLHPAMKDRFFKSLGLALVLGCLSLSPGAMAQEVKTPAKPSAEAEAQAKKLRADMIVPGVAT